MQLRQGDILLKRIASVPADAEENKERVLARGETTGHSHKVQGGKVIRSQNGQLYVLAGQETELLHEEHKTVRVPPGTYEVLRQVEYDPIAERQVSD